MLLNATWSQVQGRGIFLRHRLLATVWTFLVLCSCLDWSEGSDIVVGVREIDSSMKRHETEPGLVLGPQHAHRVRKRSFIRAQRRALQFGYTWYKGRIFTADRANLCPSLPRPPMPTQSNLPPPPKTQRQRLTLFSWNAGSLSPASWDLLQQWLDDQDIDVCAVQETHWQFTSEWTTSRYHCLHSGLNSRQAGLLCLISKRLCPADQISWNEIDPGRLIHIRLHGTHRHIDLIQGYQHVHSANRMESRSTFWDMLNDQLTSLPKRNMLYLFGDFNTSLMHRSNVVGLGTFLHRGRRCTGTVHHDSDILHQILRQHDLLTLNTWSHQLGPTYIHQEVVSRLDYICCRRWHSDRTARDVHHLDDFPLVLPSGAHHVPLLTSTPRCWTPPPSLSSNRWSHKQRLQLYQQFHASDPTIDQLRTDIQHGIQQLPLDDHCLPSLHRTLHTCSRGTRTTTTAIPVHQYDLTPFQAFKYHGDALKAISKVNRANVFRSWVHIHRLLQARKQMNRTAKTARQAKMQLVFDQADQAERASDHFRLYQAVRKLAPKVCTRRTQLRNLDGTIASPSQAADLLHDWYSNMYQAQPSNDAFEPQPLTWPFSVQEFCCGLQKLPLMKSLAPDYVPAVFWHLGAWDIAQHLHHSFEHWSSVGSFPQEWSRGHLVFLPKPGKAGHRPDELRPISLLEPSGKTILGLIASRLLQQTFWLLGTLPMFAYLPQRGCYDALTRVFLHCKHVREQLQHVKYPIHRSSSGAAMPQLFGGLLLSLDLSRAFDEVCRSRLFAALIDIGVDSDIIQLLQHIYSHTSFEFLHKQEFRSFLTHKGIRQGCKAAPILWCIFTADILVQLADSLSWTFIEQCLTVYADDFCQHSMFDSLSAFEDALCKAGHLMDCLTDMGLILNTDKTVVLCRYVGTQSAKMVKKHFLRTHNGTFLKVPRRDGQHTLIKLVSEYTYLGVKISYGNFERLTMHHRIKAGERTQASLHKWLHLKTGLRTGQRLRIWRQCVFASMTHGIFHVGFNVQDLILFHRKCMQQIRRIFKEPVYVTRESHCDFLRRHCLLAPLELLQRLCCQIQLRETQRKITTIGI